MAFGERWEEKRRDEAILQMVSVERYGMVGWPRTADLCRSVTS